MNRNLSLLVSSQVFAFTAATVTVFISGIIGAQLSPIKTLSTLPPSIYVVGTAAATIFAAKIMSIVGRRIGFVLASITGSIACLIGAYAIIRKFYCFLYFEIYFRSYYGFQSPISICSCRKC